MDPDTGYAEAFRRIHLKAGESQTVSFDIKPEMLSFLDAEGHAVLEPGDFEVMIGPNSRDLKKTTLNVK